jgi:hypothetical protein
VALLLAAIVVGGLLNRRRRNDEAPMDRFDDFDDRGDDFDDFEDPGVADVREEEKDRYAPANMWAMPGDPGGQLPDDQDSIDTAPTLITAEPELEYEDEPEFDDESEPEDEFEEPEFEESGYKESGYEDEEAASAYEEPEPEFEEVSSGLPTGRHAAVHVDEPAPTQTSFRLATDDPFHAPDGYPIKADTTTGQYWAPGSGRYDLVRADIWFASEEFALTNGFVKG